MNTLSQVNQFTLISHALCPYVQRAVTVLEEHSVNYKRIDINLADKPDWFKTLSPLGKVPVLLVNDETVLFESSVISEYLNDVQQGSLLASEPLEKAKQKAWVEFASSTLSNIAQLYSAVDAQAYHQAEKIFQQKLRRIESNLTNGPYFNGHHFSLIDAAFSPVFRYLDVFEILMGKSFFKALPALDRWRYELLSRPSVNRAVGSDYPLLLIEFLAKKSTYLGLMAQEYLTTNQSQKVSPK